MMTEGGDSTKQRIEYGFRLCTARRPSGQELQVLLNIYNERPQQYRGDPETAAKLLSVGESLVDGSLDEAELAAWATVGRVLLNLSEFITKG